MLKRKVIIGLVATFVGGALLASCEDTVQKDSDLFKGYASQLMEDIFNCFQAKDCPCGRELFYETFPHRGENVTYVVEGDSLKHERVAYLWPTSSAVSGLNALYKATGAEEYKVKLEQTVVPIVECYYDMIRTPHAYQSYPTVFGQADRYYDDNTWLGLEFLNLYEQLGKKEYLSKVESIWNFLESGRDSVLNGGLYWCEQKKFTKNTCSNAPVVVMAARMHLQTSEAKYLEAAEELYAWIKEHLRDSEDGLYYDNIHLDGTIEEGKYTYNSGQMMQAASLLYGITQKKVYLDDAQRLAEACSRHFFTVRQDGEKEIRLLNNGNIWFAAVMLRGYEELYRIDGNPVYIQDYKTTLRRLWKEGRDANGLFSNNRLSEPTLYEKDDKWLLTQAALVEMYARLSAIE